MLAYLQLLRLPTVFTALADIALGFILTKRGIEPLSQFLPLLGASAGLYLAGMVFNDVFDRKLDAVERPERPIPSGRVPVGVAVALGTVLMLAGVGAAASVSVPATLMALLLVVAILAYDAVLKRTPLGPLGMGVCRFLNVMLGACHYDLWWYVWTRPQLVCALCLGLYIVGVTWFARTEAKVSNRGHLIGAITVICAAIAALATFTWQRGGEANPQLILLMLGYIAFSLTIRSAAAIRDPAPSRVQGLIPLMLLNYVMLDAILIYWHTNSGPLALGTACLVIPAMFLSRYIRMT